MITATLSNSNGSFELPLLEVPLSEEIIDSSTDIVTLDNNMYTDFTPDTKRRWSFPFTTMSETDYNSVKMFFNEQFTLYEYPTLSIPYYGIDQIPVRMYLNTKEVWNNCGDIQNIELSLRETDQLPEAI
jgi:hypothetical protein